MPARTQKRILAYMQKHQTASVLELARALKMTGANVRHHLEELESSGMVETIGTRKEGAGRPKGLFAPTDVLLGDSLGVLASALLQEWQHNLTREQLEQQLKSLARRLAEGAAINGEASFAQRLGFLVEALNRLHYLARWEAAASGPRLVLGHCPFASIIDEHPELCRLDHYLLEFLLEQRVEQRVKLERNSRGVPYCEFRVGG